MQTPELDQISELLPEASLDDPLVFAETVVAISKPKAGKACGPNGIEPELLRAFNGPCVRLLHEYFCRIWDELEPLPDKWKMSYLVPLPKPGGLTQCSRWRGVLFSSVPGKVFARILNARLNGYVEQNPSAASGRVAAL